MPRARDTDRPQTRHMYHITLLNSLQEMASLELTCCEHQLRITYLSKTPESTPTQSSKLSSVIHQPPEFRPISWVGGDVKYSAVRTTCILSSPLTQKMVYLSPPVLPAFTARPANRDFSIDAIMPLCYPRPG